MCKQYEVIQMNNRDPNSKYVAARRGWIARRNNEENER